LANRLTPITSIIIVQTRYSLERGIAPRRFPVPHECIVTQLRPLTDYARHRRRQATFNDRAVRDPNQGAMTLVADVEVRQPVIIVELRTAIPRK
jgi:hypothetical protein